MPQTDLLFYGLLSLLGFTFVAGVWMLCVRSRRPLTSATIGIAVIALAASASIYHSELAAWELVLFYIVVGGVVLPLTMRLLTSRRQRGLTAAGLLVLFVSASAIWRPEVDSAIDEHIPRRIDRDGYVSSNTCRSCHPGHFASWHRSYHRTMTQLADPEAILAPFDGREFRNRGQTYRVERRGDEFWVSMPDADWEESAQLAGYDLSSFSEAPLVERRVLLVTGSHHVQGYWVSGDAGRELHLFPFYYHLETDRWIPTLDSLLCPPDTPPPFETWNATCIRCHSTGWKSGMQPETIEAWLTRTARWETEVAELGIACEACHGPAEEHVRLHRNPLHRYRAHRDGKDDPTIVNPADCPPAVSSQICGQCHSNSIVRDPEEEFISGSRFRPGDELNLTQELVRFEISDDDRRKEKVESIYWSDGNCRIGGDEYNGLVMSACFEAGSLSCLNCHSMHESEPDDQLAAGMETNQACTQCHAESRFREQLELHTRHDANSAGSVCYNCHMPHTSYALFTAMRSHRIDSPVVSSARERNSRPNACNLCHLDRTLEWTSDRLSDWYESPQPVLDSDDKQVAASLLWLLRGDAAQRAIAAWHFSWPPTVAASGTEWQAPFLARSLDDPYSIVRYLAGRSLQQLPQFSDVKYDFLAESEKRVEMERAVLDAWRNECLPTLSSPNPATLVGPNGTLDAEIERLQRERDDRPILIPE